MAGTVFGELYFLQAHKIVAGTVICEVWHLPRILLWSALESCFLGHVLFASVPLCFAFHGLFSFCEFRATRNTFGTLAVT